MSDQHQPLPPGYWLLTALARAASAAKEVLLAMVLGASPAKDALVVAWTAPTLLAAYCNESLPALLTPLWVRPGQAGARRLVVLALGALALLSAVGVLWPGLVVAVVAPALPLPARAWAVGLERWLALNIVLLGAQSLLTARLNAERRFSWAPLAAGLPACGVMAALVCSRGAVLPARLQAIALGLTAGSAIGLAALLAACWSLPPRPRATDHGPRTAAPVLRPLGALLLAMLVINLIPLAERMAASGLRPGSVAAYDYGERLILFVFGLSVAPFTAVSFTRLSELAAAGGREAFARQFERSLQGLLTVVMPLAAGLVVFAPLITRSVYGWGRFSAASVAATAPVVAIRGAGLGLDAVFYYLLFGLYACGRAANKLPAVALVAALNLPLAFTGARVWGVAGLAGAHLAAYTAAVGWMWARRGALLPGVRWRGSGVAAAQAGGLALAAALAARALLPAAALAGQAGGLASWGWMLAAVALTAAGTLALAQWLAPGLLRGLQRGLWAAPQTALAAAKGGAA